MSFEKRVLMVIAQKDFRDEEYFVPLDLFREAGIEVVTASSKEGIAIGALGGEAVSEISFEDISSDDFDAIVLSGGGGAYVYFDNTKLHEIIRKFNDDKKIIAAICIAPVILSNAGVLDGKTATVWQDDLNRVGPKALKKGGAIVSKNNVEESENIITANGPSAAEDFAKKIIESLRQKV